MNVHPLKLPVPDVVHALADPIDPRPLIANVIAVETENPLPDAVSVAPLGPCVGLKVSVGVVILYWAVALSEGTVPTSAPEAEIVYVPSVPLTVNVQLNVPADGPVATATHGFGVEVPNVAPPPPNVIVVPGVKPLRCSASA